jgi:hypothetical protein
VKSSLRYQAPQAQRKHHAVKKLSRHIPAMQCNEHHPQTDKYSELLYGKRREALEPAAGAREI